MTRHQALASALFGDVFFGVAFLGDAFLDVAAFLAGDFLVLLLVFRPEGFDWVTVVLLFVTRPDLVLPRMTGLSSTAGA